MSCEKKALFRVEIARLMFASQRGHLFFPLYKLGDWIIEITLKVSKIHQIELSICGATYTRAAEVQMVRKGTWSS